MKYILNELVFWPVLVAGVVAQCLCVGGAVAQSCDAETSKILAPDGSSNDNFGGAVAIHGSLLLAGSGFDDEAGWNAGAAYLYDLSSGEQLYKLYPEDRTASGYFGSAVALSGTTALVGSHNDWEGQWYPGSVHIFDALDGERVHYILSPELNLRTHFGWAVDIDGVTGIVGAPFDHQNGSYSGAAYVIDTVAGVVTKKLLPDDGHEEGRFGYSVGISGTTAIIGSSHTNPWGCYSGAIHLFDTGTGEQIARLSSPEVEKSDRYGSSVAIDGSLAVVGAPWDDDLGLDAGAAYVFDIQSGEMLYKLLPADGELYDEFGFSVAISGTTILVGSPKDNDNGLNSGSIYVFDGITGEQIRKIRSSDGEYGDRFGDEVAIHGTNAVAGAFQDDDLGWNSGSSYVFDIRNEPCLADISEDCALNFADVSAFMFAFGSRDSAVDFSGDGEFNFFDVSLFLSSFADGCP